MVILDLDQPLGARHTRDTGTYGTIGENLLDAPIAAEGIDARVRRILQDPQNTAVGQASPEQLARPHTAVTAFRKQQVLLGKSLHHRVSGPGFAKHREDQLDGAAYVLVRILHNPIGLVEHIAHWQGKPQLSFLRFVQLSALQSTADEVEFRLGHRALQSQQKTIIEIAGIVTPVFIDDQRAGNAADLDQPMPIRVGACEAGGLQREDGSGIAQRHIGYERLEVGAIRRG